MCTSNTVRSRLRTDPCVQMQHFQGSQSAGSHLASYPNAVTPSNKLQNIIPFPECRRHCTVSCIWTTCGIYGSSMFKENENAVKATLGRSNLIVAELDVPSTKQKGSKEWKLGDQVRNMVKRESRNFDMRSLLPKMVVVSLQGYSVAGVSWTRRWWRQESATIHPPTLPPPTHGIFGKKKT